MVVYLYHQIGNKPLKKTTYMQNTYSTKSEAISSGKEMLRRKTGVKRLNNLSITPTWSNCNCGETHGYNLVHITKNGHGRVESIIVSVCKSCA